VCGVWLQVVATGVEVKRLGELAGIMDSGIHMDSRRLLDTLFPCKSRAAVAGSVGEWPFAVLSRLGLCLPPCVG
jgi:hypothetical protein